MKDRARLDRKRLAACLDAKRRYLGLSWRQVAMIVGLSPSLMSRIQNETHRPDVDSFLALCGWLEFDATHFALGEKA